jgi:hypothetical protein
MRVVSVKNVGKNFEFPWPGSLETYDYFIEYEAIAMMVSIM